MKRVANSLFVLMGLLSAASSYAFNPIPGPSKLKRVCYGADRHGSDYAITVTQVHGRVTWDVYVLFAPGEVAYTRSAPYQPHLDKPVIDKELTILSGEKEWRVHDNGSKMFLAYDKMVELNCSENAKLTNVNILMVLDNVQRFGLEKRKIKGRLTFGNLATGMLLTEDEEIRIDATKFEASPCEAGLNRDEFEVGSYKDPFTNEINTVLLDAPEQCRYKTPSTKMAYVCGDGEERAFVYKDVFQRIVKAEWLSKEQGEPKSTTYSCSQYVNGPLEPTFGTSVDLASCREDKYLLGPRTKLTVYNNSGLRGIIKKYPYSTSQDLSCVLVK